MKTTSVFVYGTLTHPQVVRTLLGRNPTASTTITNYNKELFVGPIARLEGYSRHPVRTRVFPGMIPCREEANTKNSNEDKDVDLSTSSVLGCVLLDVTPLELKLLDWFEADEYDRLPGSQ